MTRIDPLLRLATLALVVTPLVSACNETEQKPKPAESAPAPAAPKHEATAERARQRSAERWEKIEKGDLYAAYAYYSPEYQRQVSLQEALQKGANHKYEGMRVVEVVGQAGEDIFLRTTGLWTPQHPTLKNVKLEPGQTLTQEIELIEEWRFGDGDWFYFKPYRPEEFAQEHPELLKGADPK